MFLDKKSKNTITTKRKASIKILATAGNRTRDLSHRSLESNLSANETTERVH